MWTYPPSQILVPIDFGDASTRAIQVAGALAGRLASTLQLLHVETFDAPPYFTHEQIARIEGEMMVNRRFGRHTFRHGSERSPNGRVQAPGWMRPRNAC